MPVSDGPTRTARPNHWFVPDLFPVRARYRLVRGKVTTCLNSPFQASHATLNALMRSYALYWPALWLGSRGSARLSPLSQLCTALVPAASTAQLPVAAQPICCRCSCHCLVLLSLVAVALAMLPWPLLFSCQEPADHKRLKYLACT